MELGSGLLHCLCTASLMLNTKHCGYSWGTNMCFLCESRAGEELATFFSCPEHSLRLCELTDHQRQGFPAAACRPSVAQSASKGLFFWKGLFLLILFVFLF